jgi:hypothetical protein
MATTEYVALHLKARKIKGYCACETCGSTKNIDVHHINNDYTDNSEDNLKSLCRKCHVNLHKPWEQIEKKHKIIKCKECGNKFYQFNGKKIFCSKSCAAKNRVIKKRINVKCKECGVIFEKRPCEIKNGEGKFCSRKCRKKYGYHRK